MWECVCGERVCALAPTAVRASVFVTYKSAAYCALAEAAAEIAEPSERHFGGRFVCYVNRCAATTIASACSVLAGGAVEAPRVGEFLELMCVETIDRRASHN